MILVYGSRKGYLKMKFFDKKEYARWYYQNYGKYGKKKGREQKKMGPMQQSIADAKQKLQRQGINPKAPILGPNLARNGSPTRNSINTATRNVRRANNPLTKKKPSRYMESINSASRSVRKKNTRRNIMSAPSGGSNKKTKESPIYINKVQRKVNTGRNVDQAAEGSRRPHGAGRSPSNESAYNMLKRNVSSISRKAKRKGRKIYRKLRSYFN